MGEGGGIHGCVSSESCEGAWDGNDGAVSLVTGISLVERVCLCADEEDGCAKDMMQNCAYVANS